MTVTVLNTFIFWEQWYIHIARARNKIYKKLVANQEIAEMKNPQKDKNGSLNLFDKSMAK